VLGSSFIPASNAALQASLSKAFFSPRQTVISSALGMNALQSLSTSGVQARRWSSVPCEKEGVGKAVADSKASDKRHRVKCVSRSSIHLFRSSAFIRGSPSAVVVDIHEIGYEYTFAGARACSETSAFVAFEAVAPLRFPNAGAEGAQTSKSSDVCPSVRNNANANGSRRTNARR
jgi:hypothetical protein